jgi:hypothetical protein
MLLISEIMRAVLKSPECRKFFLATSTFPEYESPAYTRKTMLFLPIGKKETDRAIRGCAVER